jgi:D-sedoheptulose 7-phosphate isomerase
MFDRAPMASLALGTNNSAMSAIGNDYGYEQVFARDLQGIAQPADVFVPISTSGNSANVLAAVAMARHIKVKTVALTGISGGRLIDICECIRAPSIKTARIQEGLLLLGHVLCGLVGKKFFH